MKSLEETTSIVESLNEEAHNDAWDTWVEADELSNNAVDDDDMAEAEDLREQASEEQAGYFRDLVDQLADEDKVSIEHWLKLDIDFRDQFSSWYGSEEFRGKYGNYD
jgi:hypothetical protein